MVFHPFPFRAPTRFTGPWFVRRGLLAVATLAIGTSSAPAVDYTWNNTTANWNVGANWTPGGGPPAAPDNAFLLGATAYTVTLNDNRAITNLTINNANAILSQTSGTFTVGGTITLTAGTLAMSGGTITGGSITTGGGSGRLQVGFNNNNILNNVAIGAGVIDFGTPGGRVRLQGTTGLAAGTVLTLSGSSNILAFDQTATVNGVTITVSTNANSVTVEATNTLTLGPATTIDHTSGFGNNNLGNQFFVAGANTVLNQGLIRNTGTGIFNIVPTTFTNQSGGIVRATAGGIAIASGGLIGAAGSTFDVAGGTISLNGTNWSNTGTLAVGSGTLNLGGTFATAGIGPITRTGGAIAVTGTMDNTAATLALTAGTGSFQLNGGTISGGAISFAGGAALQPLNNNNNRLNNVAIGAGVLDFGTAGGRVRLQGTTGLAAGTVLTLSGSSNILAFDQTATVNGATITVSTNANSVTVEATNTLTLGPATTIDHTSGFGNNNLGNQFFVTGANTLLNQGLIRNTGTGIFNIVPTTFTNTGNVRASAGGIAIPTTTNLTNFAGSTLTGGTWEAVGTGNLNFGTRTINSIAAGTTVTLDGAGSVFAAVNTVTANAGTFNVLNGRAFTVSGGTLTNTGTVQIGTTATVTGVINTTGDGTVMGNGTVVGNVGFSGTGNTLRPGTSPGHLTVTGNLTLNAGTTYVAEVNGTTVGSQYDRVTVNGAGNVVSLNGAALNVALGYDPSVNDRLFVIDNQTNNAVSGTFAGLPSNGSTFQITNPNTSNTFLATIFYVGDTSSAALAGGNDVVIVFTPVPEPASVFAMCALGVGMIGAFGRRRGNQQNRKT